MSASLWAADESLSANRSVRHQSYVTTNNQTNFTLTEFSYSVDTDSLYVYVSGVFQRPGIDYYELTPYTFQLANAVPAGTIVVAVAMVEVNATISRTIVLTETVVATEGQTVIPIGNFTYTLGGNHLKVFVNGLLQYLTDHYTETSPDSITFTAGLKAGDKILLVTNLFVNELENSGGVGVANVVMSATDVVLTQEQYFQEIILVTGTLTSNLNLSFPGIAGEWTVINNTTGGYSVVAKTTSGSGVTLGTISQIVGDGTNIYAANPDSVQIVTNVATLRNIAPSLSRRIQTRGYYTDGDGGAAQYFPKVGAAPGTYVHNGGTVIVPNGGDGSAAWLLDITNGISVKQCGAKGLKGGGGDDTTAFATAVASLKAVYVPEDTYTINLSIQNRTVIYGDGSTATLIKPYNTAVAAMTYTFTAMTVPGGTNYWNYHSEVRDIGFLSSGKVGVGFTFAKTNPSDYATNDEYANNVKFYGCNFQGFNKGVQFPFGNIGSEFYSCGFGGNKYGVYTLNNKFGGVMHAGNKYFYAGEFHGNDCAVYLHNTADGFGALCFKDTIIEGNSIGLYAYIYPRVTVPVSLDNVWLEGNGVQIGGSTTIDSWTGSTVGSQTLTNKTIIIDGDGGKVNLNDGFVCDVWLKGPNIEFIARNSRAEGAVGYGGGALVVDYPDTSYILLENPTSDGGWRGSGTYTPLVRGNMRDTGMILNPGSRSSSRVFRTNMRGAKVTNYGPSRAMSASLTTSATTGGGSFGLTGTVVSDGRLYNQCNEFTRAAFTAAQFTRLNSPDSLITTAAGWYVFTLDMKVVSGAGVKAYVWDRSTAQLAVYIECPNVGYWHTFAAIGYSAGGQTLYLDFSGNGGDVTWRVSAYQIHRFDTLQEAQNFIASNVFAES